MEKEFEITIHDENADNLSLDLIEYLRSQPIDEVKSIDLMQLPPEDGKMGFEIMDKIKMIIEAANKPLNTLAQALVEWVKGRKTSITVKLPDGTEVIMDGNNLSGAEKIIEAARGGK
ncbi:MAG: effector-associated constant component EACC1 [Chitinophagales bacterium]